MELKDVERSMLLRLIALRLDEMKEEEDVLGDWESAKDRMWNRFHNVPYNDFDDDSLQEELRSLFEEGEEESPDDVEIPEDWLETRIDRLRVTEDYKWLVKEEHTPVVPITVVPPCDYRTLMTWLREQGFKCVANPDADGSSRNPEIFTNGMMTIRLHFGDWPGEKAEIRG